MILHFSSIKLHVSKRVNYCFERVLFYPLKTQFPPLKILAYDKIHIFPCAGASHNSGLVSILLNLLKSQSCSVVLPKRLINICSNEVIPWKDHQKILINTSEVLIKRRYNN